jgi:hypothetical protein
MTLLDCANYGAITVATHPGVEANVGIGDFVATNVQRARMPLKMIRINDSIGELCVVFQGEVVSFGKYRTDGTGR